MIAKAIQEITRAKREASVAAIEAVPRSEKRLIALRPARCRAPPRSGWRAALTICRTPSGLRKRPRTPTIPSNFTSTVGAKETAICPVLSPRQFLTGLSVVGRKSRSVLGSKAPFLEARRRHGAGPDSAGTRRWRLAPTRRLGPAPAGPALLQTASRSGSPLLRRSSFSACVNGFFTRISRSRPRAGTNPNAGAAGCVGDAQRLSVRRKIDDRYHAAGSDPARGSKAPRAG